MEQAGMRERVDRGLEPIAAVVVRVVETAALLYQKPWLSMKTKDLIRSRRWWRHQFEGGPPPPDDPRDRHIQLLTAFEFEEDCENG